MHIVMLSDLEMAAGASIVAGRLATGLIEAGTRVTQIVGKKEKGDFPWQTRVLTAKDMEGRLAKFSRGKYSKKLVKRLVVMTLQTRLSRMLKELKPDVINVHNVHSNIARWDLSLIETCAKHAPVVWTLHDMWSFTGRCAYSYDCRKFQTGCDVTCPTPTEYPALEPEGIAAAWKKRQHLFTKYENLVAVSPSRWLAQEAVAGFWKGHRIEIIPNGLPLDIYRSVKQKIARAELGIKSNEFVILFVGNLAERRKGGAILLQALANLKKLPVTLVTMGIDQGQVSIPGINYQPLGFVSDEHTKVLAYNAADLLVHPAPVDNLPNTILESIACGTPCIGFEIGGISEIVRAGLTGWLCRDRTSQELTNTINKAISDIQYESDYRQTCRSIAEKEYALQIQANRYLKLFQSFSDND